MSSTITIYQSQSVLFTDTSSGGVPPYSRLWSFTGGDISSSTGATALVTYSNPGAYTASLTVTDDIGVSASYTSSSGITVNPPIITASFTSSPASSVLMSATISFNDTSTGIPSGPTGWSWSIGGSGFANTQNPSLLFNDWQLVPGANIFDPAGTSLTVSAQLLASNSFTSDSESKNIIFSKIGINELTLLNREAEAAPYQRFADISYTGTIASSLGYPTGTYVYEIDLASYGFAVNQFHSDLEVAYMVVTGLTGKPEFLESGVSTISGYILVDDAFYASGSPEIAFGKYLTPSYNAKKIFFTDSGSVGNLTNLVTAKNWSTSLIASVLTNIHPQLNSAQGIYYGIVYPTSSYNNGRNPIVYSPQYLTSIGAVGENIEITIYVDAGINYQAVCSINDNGGLGNETGGDYYVMQDISGNLGVASMLNSAIAASPIPGGTASVEFFADPDLNIYVGGSPASYYGLRMEVKDASVSQVTLLDNTETLNSNYGLSLIPVFYTYTGSTQPSCIGMPPLLNLNYLEYTSTGTRIVYGNSIF